VTAPAVTVYTAEFCGHCVRVMTLLQRRGIPFTEVSAEDHPGLREQLLAKSGRRTLPQIYVGERYVGGADELMALDQRGGLLRLIQVRNDDG
jgi:glutaredoxin 3